VLLIFGTAEKLLTGTVEAKSTAAVAELTACRNALLALKKPCHVRMYVADGNIRDAFNQDWYERWEERNWRTSSGGPVKHRALWEAVRQAAAPHRIEWLQPTEGDGDRWAQVRSAATRLLRSHPTVHTECRQRLDSAGLQC
jgi:ribonuclease HI